MTYKSIQTGINAAAPEGIANTVTARTATATGATTGTIADGTEGYIMITATNADHIIILPTPTIGAKLALVVNANGCELRTSDPENVSLNGVTGANKELALGATTITYVKCTEEDAWKAVTHVGTGITSVSYGTPD